MKTKYKILPALLLLAPMFCGCIDETLPETNYLTADQVSEQPSALQGFVKSITGKMASTGTYYSDCHEDIGYPGLGIIRDNYTEDMPIFTNSYDYFSYYVSNTYLGEYSTADFPWTYYYALINNCHSILRLEETDLTAPYFGIAHFWRAWFYFDMARMYEFKETGFPELDNQAAADGIAGLTVPMMKENTTEEEARNMPRAIYYDMYRFILDDLDAAAERLDGVARASKADPDLSTVNGMRARVYLEMATRFDFHPEDLQKAIEAGVDLGGSNAADFYRLADEYAGKAIAASGAPLTRDEWYGGASGNARFNDINTGAWMLGLIINTELLNANNWKSFIAYMSVETNYGISGITNVGGYANSYGGQRMIGVTLYNTLTDDDWRKQTWIAPEDAGLESSNAKYVTCVADGHFAQLPAYTGLKFAPRNGNGSDYSVGSAVDYPLMRVEEMYLIQAEAKAGASGVGAGVAALNQFVNSYRSTDGSYSCTAASMDDFREELLRQKRIEFWGEGLVAWDYKRLNHSVTRGYTGTNFVETYRVNSKNGYCAPWLTTFILRSERRKNLALKPNPDPSIISALWYE